MKKTNKSVSKSKSKSKSPKPKIKPDTYAHKNNVFFPELVHNKKGTSPDCIKLSIQKRNIENFNKRKAELKKEDIKKFHKKDEIAKSIKQNRDDQRNEKLNSLLQKLNFDNKQVNSNDYTFDRLPMNINEYQHLLLKSKIVAADVSWVLGLREKETLTEKIKKTEVDLPFSFYDRDVPIFNQKMEELRKIPCEYNKKITRPFSHKDDHLVRHRKEVNLTQTSFETTLREFPKYRKNEFNKTLNENFKKNKEWLSNPNQTQSSFYFSETFPFFKATNTKSEKDGSEAKSSNKESVNNWLIRPYEKKFEKTNYTEKSKLLRKTMVEAENKTNYFLGEHKSLPSFDIKYGSENLQNYKHLMTKQSDIKQSTVNWEVGLRGLPPHKAIKRGKQDQPKVREWSNIHKIPKDYIDFIEKRILNSKKNKEDPSNANSNKVDQIKNNSK